MTGLDAFDKTVQKTERWLKELGEELHWEDRHRSYLALRSVLHALRDRLPPEEAAQLGAQLPMLVRGFYYEGWSPSGRPVKERHLEDFLGRVEADIVTSGIVDPVRITKAVFSLLQSKVSAGEIGDVKQALPEEVRQLWPE